MKKRININFSNKTFYTISALAIIALFAIGVYAYGGTSPSTMGHTFGEIEPPSGCDSGEFLRKISEGIGWDCSLEGISNTPSDIKITSSSHNGDFGGYAAMNDWIQTNGCSGGYHVCDGAEITKYLQNGNSLPGPGWYNSGGLTDGTIYGDCLGWTLSTLDNYGIIFSLDDDVSAPQRITCASNYYVLCCKY